MTVQNDIWVASSALEAGRSAPCKPGFVLQDVFGGSWVVTSGLESSEL